jgi:mandelamide amidase
MDLSALTLIDAARALRVGEVSAEAYVTALLERCAAHRDLNVFIALDRDAVLTAACAADKRRASGAALGALHGVPLIIKDNLDCVGYATTGGTPALRDNRPKQNAAVVRKLLDAGAIVLGKANMHEMAFGITNNAAAFGPARNPYDPTRIPGGSSGGTAAAVAAHLAPAGIGSDTGGSVRIPASFCGIAGFRPSLGRWPTDGILPISHSRDTAGPMARAVADCVLLDTVVTGAAPQAPRAIGDIRLGVPRRYFCEPLDAELAGLFDSFLGQLREAGATLIEVDLSGVKVLNERAGMAITGFELRGEIPAYLSAHGLAVGLEALVAQIASPDVRRMFAQRADITEASYRAAVETDRPALRKLYADCFAEHALSALIFPTTPLPAPKIGEDDTTTLNGAPVPTFPTVARNTGPGSVAGLPGVAFPIGLTRAGLPIGVELDGPIDGDRNLLAAALALEALAPRLPPPF